MDCPYSSRCWRYAYSRYYTDRGYKVPPERKVLLFAGYATLEMMPTKGIWADNMPINGLNLCPNQDYLTCYEYNKETKRINNWKTARASKPIVINNRKFVRPSIPDYLKRLIAKRDKYKCVYCYRVTNSKDATGKRIRGAIDHLIPVALGGETTEDNLCYTCWDCNSSKGDSIGTLDPARVGDTTVWYRGCRVGFYGGNYDQLT